MVISIRPFWDLPPESKVRPFLGFTLKYSGFVELTGIFLMPNSFIAKPFFVDEVKSYGLEGNSFIEIKFSLRFCFHCILGVLSQSYVSCVFVLIIEFMAHVAYLYDFALNRVL